MPMLPNIIKIISWAEFCKISFPVFNGAPFVIFNDNKQTIYRQGGKGFVEYPHGLAFKNQND